MGPLGAYGWKAVDAILAAHNPDRVRWQVIGALVAVAACGPEPATDAALPTPALVPPWESGERLRATVRVGTNGASVLAHWYDRERDIECAFVPTADGYRCLPLVTGSRRHTTQDCGSLDGVAVTEGCVADWGGDPVQVETEHGACPQLSEVVVATKLEHLGQLYRLGSDDRCVPVPGFGEQDWAAEPVSLSSFVGAEVSVAPVGQLGVTQLEGTDGSKQRLRVSTLNGEACDESELRRDGRCIPGPLLHADAFADEACSVSAAVDTSCGTARYIRSETVEDLFELGEPLAQRYRKTEIGCVLQEDQHPAYRVGTQVARSNFEVVEHTAEPAGGLVPRWWSIDAAPIVWSDDWLLAGTECDIREFSAYDACVTGVVESFEHGGPARGPSADPQCSISTFQVYTSSSSVDFISEWNRGCGSDYHSPIPVQVHDGAVFARNDTGDCVEVQPPEDGLLVVESEDHSSLEAFSYRVE